MRSIRNYHSDMQRESSNLPQVLLGAGRDADLVPKRPVSGACATVEKNRLLYPPYGREKPAQRARPAERAGRRIARCSEGFDGRLLMSVDLIGWLTILYAIAMLRAAAGLMLSMFCFALIFQAAAAIKIGGIGITPSHSLLAIFVIYLWRKGYDLSMLREICRPPNAGFWMLLLVSYCILTGIFIPRLFEGMTYVQPIGTTAYQASDSPVPLGPSSGNITQSIYILGSLVVFLAVSLFLDSRRAVNQSTVALVVYACGIIIFGVIDLISNLLNASYVLNFLHNGNFTFHLNESIVGVKRIAGSFSEASAFAGATLGVLGFTLGLFLNGVFPILTAILSLAEIGMLLISTSTTGIVGLAFVVGGAYCLSLKEAITGRAHYWSFLFVIFAPLVAACVVPLFIINQSALSSVTELAQALIYDKAGSDSAQERQALNSQAIVNVIDTFGVGAGSGSVRTSSFPLAVIANLGIVGSLIYGSLLFMVFFGNESQTDVDIDRSVQLAARLGAWGSLAPACISGTLVDLGLPFFVFAAISCGVNRNRPGALVSKEVGQPARASAPMIRLSR